MRLIAKLSAGDGLGGALLVLSLQLVRDGHQQLIRVAVGVHFDRGEAELELGVERLLEERVVEEQLVERGSRGNEVAPLEGEHASAVERLLRGGGLGELLADVEVGGDRLLRSLRLFDLIGRFQGLVSEIVLLRRVLLLRLLVVANLPAALARTAQQGERCDCGHDQRVEAAHKPLPYQMGTASLNCGDRPTWRAARD
jgi:hypothetical protein